MKNNKRSLLMSVTAIFLCLIMLAGTTYAWFTDSVTSGNCKIVAGNLDVDLLMDKNQNGTYVSIAGEEGALFGGENSLVAQNDSTDTLWEPGKTQIVYLGVKNNGPLAIKYDIQLTVTDNGLASALEYAIIDGAKKSDVVKYNVVNWNTLKALVGVQTGNLGEALASATTPGVLKAAEGGILDECVKGVTGETQYFALAIHMKEDAGNTFMQKDIVIDVLLSATQYTAEKDAFDDQYDKQEDNEEETVPVVPGAVWFDSTKAGEEPTDVKEIHYISKDASAPSTAITWDAPAGATAYYDSTNHVLTYKLSTKKLHLDDSTFLTFGFFDVTDDDVLATYNASFRLAFGDKTIAELKAFDLSEFEMTGTMYELCFDATNASAFEEVTSITGLDLLDVSKVTDFSKTFYSMTKLTALDLSGWDTSKAQNMRYMFMGNEKLETLTLGSEWNTSNVTNMTNMFFNCWVLKSVDVGGWDVSNVTNMDSMFNACKSITALDVSKWNTSKVTTLCNMFINCFKLCTLDVSGWDVGNVTVMESTFDSCEKIEVLDVSKWNTAKVTTMSYTFRNCFTLTSLDLDEWDVSNVTTMTSMFECCYKLQSLNISDWNVSKVENIAGMVKNCEALTSLDLSKWTCTLKYMSSLFEGCESLASVKLGNWKTDAVSTLTAMFDRCKNLTSIDLSTVTTPNVEHLQDTFRGCVKLETLDLSHWNTSKVCDWSNMFGSFTDDEETIPGCTNLEHIYVGDGWSTDACNDGYNVFKGCEKLPNYDPANYTQDKVIDISYAKLKADGGYLETKPVS